jgi:hypothetical protein
VDLLEGLLEGFDFLVDVTIDIAADCNGHLRMMDLPGLLIKPLRNHGPAFVGIILLIADILRRDRDAFLHFGSDAFDAPKAAQVSLFNVIYFCALLGDGTFSAGECLNLRILPRGPRADCRPCESIRREASR